MEVLPPPQYASLSSPPPGIRLVVQDPYWSSVVADVNPAIPRLQEVSVWAKPTSPQPQEPEGAEVAPENPFVGDFEKLPRDLQYQIFASQLGLHVLAERAPRADVEQMRVDQGAFFGQVSNIPNWSFSDPETVAALFRKYDGTNPIDGQTVRADRPSLHAMLDNRLPTARINIHYPNYPLAHTLIYVRTENCFPDINPDHYPGAAIMGIMESDPQEGNKDVFHLVIFIPNAPIGTTGVINTFADSLNQFTQANAITDLELVTATGPFDAYLPDMDYTSERKDLNFFPKNG